jgi:hypothetical protein
MSRSGALITVNRGISAGGSISDLEIAKTENKIVGKDDKGTDITKAVRVFDDTKLPIISKYISKELKLDLMSSRQKALAQAMEKPQDWLLEREKRLEVIKERLAKNFGEQYVKYSEAGFPNDEAMEKAAKATNILLELELEDLEIEFPGGATVFGSAANVMANRNNRFGLAMGSAEGPQVDKKAIYKEMRQRKKAKKARKASKQVTA